MWAYNTVKCIAGNFRGVDLYHFAGLIFADARTHACYVLYNQAYFAVRRSSTKTAKIGPLENFPALHSNYCGIYYVRMGFLKLTTCKSCSLS